MQDELASGTRIGPYRVLRTLGSGGMGTVYLAADEEESREVALKVLRPELTEREGFFRRFRREAEAGLRMDHPNVVRTLDYGLHVVGEGPRCCLAMEYAEGRTLRDLLADLHVVPEALVREIARQVASGLAAIHAAGVVHRDVKPENVCIANDHRVRIMDLGVARLLDATETLTREGQFAGSLLYASPEQFGGAQTAGSAARDRPVPPIDGRADLYSLGVMLHELATGTHPFPHGSTSEIVAAHLKQPAPDLSDVAPDVSPFLAEVTATLLEKDPARRFPSAGDLAAVLSEGEDSAWWAARREGRRRRTSSLPRVPVRRETALRGRESDLALLRDVWREAERGRGSVLLVEGEAGIGKSRLVDEFVQGLPEGRCRALYGSFPPGGGLAGLVDAVVSGLGADRLDEEIGRALGEAPGLVPAFAAFLRNSPPPPGVPALRDDALDAVFVRLMRALAAERPLVWIVDDLHFASAESRRLVVSLARAVEGAAVLLVVTSRPPVPPGVIEQLGRTARFRRMTLARLGARDVVHLLREALRDEHLVERLGIRIAEKSDGVPFFVFEMIRALAEGHFVSQLPDGTWIESRVIDRIEIPSAVRDLLDVRLGDLGDSQRDVLDVGAVQGFEFDPDVVATVLGRRPIDALQDLARVERRSGIVRAAGHRYRFDHHLIQEVLSGALSDPLRREYHALVAETLEARANAASRPPAEVDGDLCADLADHFLRGNRPDRAVRYVERGLRHLVGCLANERAAALAALALAATGLLAGRERLAALELRAAALENSGDGAAEEEAREDALRLADEIGDPALRASARNAAGWFHATRGRAEAATRLFGEARDVCAVAGDRRGEAANLGGMGYVAAYSGRASEALPLLERQLAIGRETGDAGIEGHAHAWLGQALWTVGRVEEARRHFEQQIAIARTSGNRRLEGMGLGSLGISLVDLGRPDEALRYHEAALALSRELGWRKGEASAICGLGNVANARGDWEEAIGHHRRHLALCRMTGNRRGEAVAHGNLSGALFALGRIAESLDHARAYLEMGRELRYTIATAGALGNLGCVEAVLGDAAAARRLFEEKLAEARAGGARAYEGNAHANLAALLRDSDPARAAEHALASAEIARETGDAGSLAEAKLALATCRRLAGDPEGALAALAEVEEAVRRFGTGPLAAVAAVERALHDPAAVPAAAEALAREEARMHRAERMRAHFDLWRATSDRAHLAAARADLEYLAAHAPDERRAALLADVPLHRAIREA